MFLSKDLSDLSEVSAVPGAFRIAGISKSHVGNINFAY
jgi:hypothetical protein